MIQTDFQWTQTEVSNLAETIRLRDTDLLTAYTPLPATVANATTFRNKIGTSHYVIVLPSVYGTNNSVLLDALKQFNGTARGVAVIDPTTTSNSTLAAHKSAGVVGLRVNQVTNETEAQVIQRVRQNAMVAKQMGWVLELYIDCSIFAGLHDVIPTLGVKVVADHFAHAQTTSITNVTSSLVDPYLIPGFPEVIDLVQRKLLFVKISAPYQDSRLYPYYQDLTAIANALMINGPEMVVWGSDWPHPNSAVAASQRLVPAPYRDVDDMAMLLQAMQYAGTPQQVQRMFVDNPRRLWGWYDLNA